MKITNSMVVYAYYITEQVNNGDLTSSEGKLPLITFK